MRKTLGDLSHFFHLSVQAKSISPTVNCKNTFTKVQLVGT